MSSNECNKIPFLVTVGVGAGAGNEGQGLGNTVVQGKLQMKLVETIPVWFRTGGVNCVDIS